MVNVPRLLSAIEATVWRQGGVRGNEVRHRFEPDGALTISITIPAVVIDGDSLPRKPDPDARPSWGMVTPDLKPR
jgi:hypothetical protein